LNALAESLWKSSITSNIYENRVKPDVKKIDRVKQATKIYMKNFVSQSVGGTKMARGKAVKMGEKRV